jgi:hypothetical protein
MTNEGILELDFYDLCGCSSIWMTDEEKIDFWKKLFEKR